MDNTHGMRIRRLGDGPIISPALDPSIGNNIQGPSLIRMPEWADGALGRYHLYFADHKGGYIRLAYADEITGPWTIHVPGSLTLADSTFLTEPPDHTQQQLDELAEIYTTVFGSSSWAPELLVDATVPHIASPDVHIDADRRRFVMYFHGLAGLGVQLTKVATSADGVNFVGRPEALARPYVRAFRHEGITYALAMPGTMYRSTSGLTDFVEGPHLFTRQMRHSAVVVRPDVDNDVLHVVWTRVGDAPESLLHSTIELTDDWRKWLVSEPEVVLRPEFDWEGADAPPEPSQRSVAFGHVNQLRDPAIFTDTDEQGIEHSYVLYAVAGESGIALGEIDWI